MTKLEVSQWDTPFHNWYLKTYKKSLKMSHMEIYQDLMKKDSTILPYMEQFEREEFEED